MEVRKQMSLFDVKIERSRNDTMKTAIVVNEMSSEDCISYWNYTPSVENVAL